MNSPLNVPLIEVLWLAAPANAFPFYLTSPPLTHIPDHSPPPFIVYLTTLLSGQGRESGDRELGQTSRRNTILIILPDLIKTPTNLPRHTYCRRVESFVVTTNHRFAPQHSRERERAAEHCHQYLSTTKLHCIK